MRFGLARMLATVVRQWMPRETAAVRHNLARILPEANALEIEQRTDALFRNFACFFADLLSINRSPLPVQQRYVHAIQGAAHLHSVLASGRGIVVVTAHLGNWDLAGRLLSAHGKTVHVLTAPEQHAAIQRLLRQRDHASQLRFVTNADPGVFVQLLMALRQGDIVAVQIDRATGHRSDVLVPFFGAPARFPLGPFVLARAAQVPVLPCFCLMEPDDRYTVCVEEAITVVPGQEEQALRHLLGILERYVAQAPEQWCNFYDVWDV